MRLVSIDGEIVPAERAAISVFDRGFLYGDSVFETVRSYAGELFALDEHLERLAASAAKVYLELPVELAALRAEVRAVVAEAANAESYVRVIVTRGAGVIGLDPSLAEGPRRVVIVQPLQMPPRAHYEHGVTAHCVRTARASDAADHAKLSNYVASLLALRQAKEAGADEALVVSADGLVVEGTTSNVFAVRDGVLTTPPLSAGVLAGITRREVLSTAADEGVLVREVALSVDELQRAAEVFHTSSVREIVPIVKIDGVPIGEGQPGPLTRRLHRAFRRRLGLGPRLPHGLA